MDRGSWRATVHGVTESQAPLATNIHTHTHTHTHTEANDRATQAHFQLETHPMVAI